MRWRVILGCYAVLLSAALQADVLETLAEREGMAGQFTQEIISPEGEVLERSSGSFGLLRPHFFRWEILTPDSQLLLADGSDPDPDRLGSGSRCRATDFRDGKQSSSSGY